MNEDWQEWTKLNLSRGCAPEEVRSILEDNGFRSNEIQGAMGDKYPGASKSYSRSLAARLNSSGKGKAAQDKTGFVPSDADYQVLSQVRITDSPKAKPLNDDRLQLYTIENFLNPSQCNHLIKIIDANLRPSTITSGEDKDGFRTSSTCDLGLVKNEVVKKVDQKIAKALGVQLGWSETIQGQKYDVTQEFKAHTDYFAPNSKEFEEFAAELGQRTWTFMVYLNSTPEGGETHFTEIDEVFKPKRGMAVIWNNLYTDGSPNRSTMHHGCPVNKGSKYIITKWFRDKGKGAMLFPHK